MSALTRADCLAAVRRLTRYGLDFSWLPVLSSASHSGQIWDSKAPDFQPPDVYNVAVRGRAGFVGKLNAFGVLVEEDRMFRIPLVEVPAYRFLSSFDGLRFEVPDSSAVFVFGCDDNITVSESDARERINVEPFKGARLLYTEGWLGFGLSFNTQGRTVPVVCDGELTNVRSHPLLMDALRKTGRFQATSNEGHFLAASGPPLT